jgi:hypothetical protein
VITGLCVVAVIGYFAMTDRPETVPDLSLEGFIDAASSPIIESPTSNSLPELADRRSSRGIPAKIQTSREAPATLPAQTPGQLRPDMNGTRVFAMTIAQSASQSKAKAVAASSSPGEDGEPANVRIVSVPELAAPSIPQLKMADSVLRIAPQPPLANEKSAPQNLENPRASNEPKLAGSWASFVAMKGNDLLTGAPPQERREPQGYITIDSKPETLRSGVVGNHSSQAPEHRPKTEGTPAAPQNNPPNSQESQLKRGDVPEKPTDDSGGLQHFASDFVRTDQTGNVADQHRFYADSVHFYKEGDLSWAGVEAATRRYHQERQNRRLEAAAPAVVKGPVDGGFYVVDQPVFWNQTGGSRGRSMLRLRVVPTGRGGWKITSIEEVGK